VFKIINHRYCVYIFHCRILFGNLIPQHFNHFVFFLFNIRCPHVYRIPFIFNVQKYLCDRNLFYQNYFSGKIFLINSIVMTGRQFQIHTLLAKFYNSVKSIQQIVYYFKLF